MHYKHSRKAASLLDQSVLVLITIINVQWRKKEVVKTTSLSSLVTNKPVYSKRRLDYPQYFQA